MRMYGRGSPHSREVICLAVLGPEVNSGLTPGKLPSCLDRTEGEQWPHDHSRVVICLAVFSSSILFLELLFRSDNN